MTTTSITAATVIVPPSQLPAVDSSGMLTPAWQAYFHQSLTPKVNTLTSSAVFGVSIHGSNGIGVTQSSSSNSYTATLSLGDITPKSITTTLSSIGVATGISFNSITGLAVTAPPAAFGLGGPGTGVTAARADHYHPVNSQGYHGFWYDQVNLVYECSLAYNLGTTTITITPTGSSYRVWINGVLYTYTGAQTISHTATQGLWYIYYNANGVLTASQTVWDLLSVAPVAIVYYDATTPDYIFFDERHHYDYNAEAHIANHFSIGTFELSPSTDFALSSYTIGTASNAGTQWALAGGTICDEDIHMLDSAVASAGPYQLMARTGSAGNFIRTASTLPYYPGTTYIPYNQYTGTTWQLTDLGIHQYVNYYVFGTLSVESVKQILIIPGQTTYTSLASAQAESVGSLNLTQFPTLEYCPLYQITFYTSPPNSNTGKCSIAGVNRINSTRASVSAAPGYVLPVATSTVLGGVMPDGTTILNSSGAISVATITLGTTALVPGTTVTTVAGLTSVTATTFVGALSGTATNATNVTGATQSTAITWSGSAKFTGGLTSSKLYGGQTLIGINSSTVTTIASGIGFILVVRDNGNGGTAVVLYENGQTPVIMQQITPSGGTTFVTTTPSATQVQLASVAGGGISALGGSSRGSASMNVLIMAAQ